MTRHSPKPPPLDAAALDRLALRYVERFATTRGKLVQYLTRKLRERGWAGEASPDAAAIAERMAALGYVDDKGYAAAKAGAMARRGLGARRVGEALRAAGVAEDDRPPLADDALSTALAFARRRRIGTFGDAVADRELRERQMGQMLRAGHGFALSRQLVDLAPGDPPPDGADG